MGLYGGRVGRRGVLLVQIDGGFGQRHEYLPPAHIVQNNGGVEGLGYCRLVAIPSLRTARVISYQAPVCRSSLPGALRWENDGWHILLLFALLFCDLLRVFCTYFVVKMANGTSLVAPHVYHLVLVDM